MGGVSHRDVSVAVQWEAREGDLHPRVTHLQEVLVRGESVVSARFGYLKALQRRSRGEDRRRRKEKEKKVVLQNKQVKKGCKTA